MDYEQPMLLIRNAALSVGAKQLAEPILMPILARLAKQYPVLNKLAALRIRNIERLVHQIESRIQDIETDISKTTSDDFANFAYRVVEKAAKEHRDFKTAMLASTILYSSSVPCIYSP